MKRLTALLVLIAFFSLAATSQELNSGNEVLYEQLKLSVVLNVASWSQATPESSDLRNWQGYQGAKKISEEDFLSIAGLTDKAHRAGGYKENHDFCTIAGGVIAGVGYGLFLIWSGTLLYTTSVPFPTSSVLLCGGGLGLALLGGPPNNITAREAFAIAESYNASLRQRLLSSSPIQ